MQRMVQFIVNIDSTFLAISVSKGTMLLEKDKWKEDPEIFHSVSGKSDQLLSWTHYRVLLQVKDRKARDWYEREAFQEGWSVRTLQRNISSQYNYRMLKTQQPEAVKQEMKMLTSSYQNKLEFIKNPVIAEFLGMQKDTSYLESDLEQSIIDNLQKFLMELGKGYAFVARQQHIHTEKEDYYIDLVFYNYILKCFVLIDLKTKKKSPGQCQRGGKDATDSERVIVIFLKITYKAHL